MRHAAAASWALPPDVRPTPRGIRRVNLRELAARPTRFEHHLVVVARVGVAQLEIATASEPLYFAHVNVSDEYALALPTGDELVDAFPLRTFLTDPTTGQDVARYNHRTGDLVLHPLGWMHWPGRLRPPYEPLPVPAEMLRCGLSAVLCAGTPTPAGARHTVTSGRDGDAKAYAQLAPLGLLELAREAEGVVASVGDASLRLVVHPEQLRAPRGAYVLVLAGTGAHFACDLLYLPPGDPVSAEGIDRALVLESETASAAPPPASWDGVPRAGIEPFDEASRLSLPWTAHGIVARDASAFEITLEVRGTSARVPRYWLARMLFRVALHTPALGYVETYGGFFYDDRDDAIKVGIRGGEPLELARGDALPVIAGLYRAVAPNGYRER